MRRSTGSNRKLRMRIALVLTLVAAFYLFIATAVGALYFVEPSWWPYVTPFVVAILGVTVVQARGTGGRLLRAAGARLVDRDAQSTLTAEVERFAALADIRTPLLGVVHSDRPIAFSVTLHRGRSCVVVTTGLVDVLFDGELEAVLAHEIAHIANRDASVMTAASGPRALGLTLLGSSNDSILPTFWRSFSGGSECRRGSSAARCCSFSRATASSQPTMALPCSPDAPSR